MQRIKQPWVTAFLIGAIGMAACENSREESTEEAQLLPVETQNIETTTRADTVALQVVNALGGLDTWNQIPFVRFDFATESPNRSTRRRHLWNKGSGDYRIEYASGVDSTTVVLFNINTREGDAYINGVETTGDEKRDLVARAHRMFINDTYWMLAPLKLFDDGVSRGLGEPTAEGESVLTLEFDSVGYTPGDRYWITVDDTTGRVAAWEYILQGENGYRGRWTWEDYRSIDSPAGTMTLAETRTSLLSQNRIYTENISFPETVATAMFTDPDASMD